MKTMHLKSNIQTRKHKSQKTDTSLKEQQIKSNVKILAKS